MVEKADNLFSMPSPRDVTEAEYRLAEAKMDVVDVFARISGRGVFVADLFHNRFMYVSNSPLVLFGSPADEVKERGFQFLIERTVPEDQPLIRELVEAVGNTSRWPWGDDRSAVAISCNFHFLLEGQPVLVNHRVTPLARTEGGEVWLVLCLVSPSVHSDMGHIEATVGRQEGFAVYEFDEGCWVEKNRLELTEWERTMLYLSAHGYTMSQIGEKMYRSVDTVKMYRKSVFKKLGVSNISEAIAYALNYNLL